MGQGPLVRFRDLSIPDDERHELLEVIDQLMRRATSRRSSRSSPGSAGGPSAWGSRTARAGSTWRSVA